MATITFPPVQQIPLTTTNSGPTIYQPASPSSGVDYIGATAPVFRVRTEEQPRAVTDIPVGDVKDIILDMLQTQVGNASSTVQYILAVIAIIVYIIALVLLILLAFPQIKLPVSISQSGIWNMIVKVPIIVWFLLGVAATSLFSVFGAAGKTFSPIAMGILGLVLLAYVIFSWKYCPHTMLLVAAIYTIAIAAFRLNLVGTATVSSASILETIIKFHFLVVFVLCILDMYIVQPNCATKL